MGKSKINKCKRVGDRSSFEPWFVARRRRNRVRNRLAKISRKINRKGR